MGCWIVPRRGVALKGFLYDGRQDDHYSKPNQVGSTPVYNMAKVAWYCLPYRAARLNAQKHGPTATRQRAESSCLG